jgi:hypothetical protein
LKTLRIDEVAAGGLPDLLTVEEAAVLLRIGRNKAYDLTRQWRATNGRCGLPVVEFGHTLRVPRHALERMLGVEFTAWPVAPASESTNLPSDPEPESDSDAVGCPAGTQRSQPSQPEAPGSPTHRT